jgi:hypothetical protein
MTTGSEQGTYEKLTIIIIIIIIIKITIHQRATAQLVRPTHFRDVHDSSSAKGWLSRLTSFRASPQPLTTNVATAVQDMVLEALLQIGSDYSQIMTK